MEYLRVSFGTQSLSLPRYVLGTGTPHALIVAGVHGREHSNINVAYRLAEQLQTLELAGTIEILPVANPLAFAAGTRETPKDNLNLGNTFGCAEAHSITQAIARAIGERVPGASLVLDLHAAGEARYLPHTLFSRPNDASFAARVGLHFAMRRTLTREQSSGGSLLSLLETQQQGVILELGGGMTLCPEDVKLGLRAVLGVLSYQGFVKSRIEYLPETPHDRVYPNDVRHLIRAPSAGAFYPAITLGESVNAGEDLGLWVSYDFLEPVPVPAPRAGWVIYLRACPIVGAGETLAMLIPS